jgi:cytochrome c
MKKLAILSVALTYAIYANTPQELFTTKCVMCHTDKKIDSKANLIGPHINEVLFHVKEKFSDKKEAISFMKEYIFKPDASKALCASMDKFGLMPSLKGALTKSEADAILEYIYNNFPSKDFTKKEKKDRAGINFEKLDTNKDGFVTPQEFKEFRAKRNGIDVNSLKHNLYFKKVDLNKDGKMDKEEFIKMRQLKAKLKGN